MTLNWIQRQESLQSTEQNFAKYNPRDALYSNFIFAVEISSVSQMTAINERTITF